MDPLDKINPRSKLNDSEKKRFGDKSAVRNNKTPRSLLLFFHHVIFISLTCMLLIHDFLNCRRSLLWSPETIKIRSPKLLLFADAAFLPDRIFVGFVLNNAHQSQRLHHLITYTIDQLNTNTAVLPNIRVEPLISFVNRNDSYQITRNVCDDIISHDNVYAVFSSSNDPCMTELIDSICRSVEIPHIKTAWDLETQTTSTSYNNAAAVQDSSARATSASAQTRNRRALAPSTAATAAAAAAAAERVLNDFRYSSAADLDAFPSEKHETLSSEENSAFIEDSSSTEAVVNTNNNNALPENSINLFPATDIIAKALLDLTEMWLWRDMVILYEEEYGLLRLQGILNAPLAAADDTRHRDRRMKIFLYQVSGGDFLAALNQLKRLHFGNIVVDVQDQSIPAVIEGILLKAMHTYQYHFLFTSFDMETQPGLANFRYNHANMTFLRLVQRDEPASARILADVSRHLLLNAPVTYSTIAPGLTLHKHGLSAAGTAAAAATTSASKPLLNTKEALMYDAIWLFARALHEVAKGRSSSQSSSNYYGGEAAASSSSSSDMNGWRPRTSCGKPRDPWPFQPELMGKLNRDRVDQTDRGLTGPLLLNNGRRVNFTLDVLKMSPAGIVRVGTWDRTRGLNISETQVLHMTAMDLDLIMVNITLNVTTILEKPYMMKVNDSEAYGNNMFTGFCADLLHELSQRLGFKYRLYLVPDNQYGIELSKSNWSGLIGELLRKQADVAMAPLTITYAREQVIDFTKPFMNLGISILFRKEMESPPRLFSFMKPLSQQIWGYIVLAYFIVSIELFIIARFSPYEWYNPHPCNERSEVVENQFSLINSFWYCVGTLMQQGSDIYPRALSTRLVSGIWWFFTLIIISSYTANLAAFLTVERMDSPIESAEDLAKQTEIKYGVLSGGSTYNFFKDAKIDSYNRMWNWMLRNPTEAFVSSYQEGVDRVRGGNFAFLMESTSIEYETSKDCNLTQVGSLLDSKGFGIGLPRGSPWRDKLALAILNLTEDGTIPALKNKWWKQMGEVCENKDKKEGKRAEALGVDQFGGAFLILLAGLSCGAVAAVAEFIWNSRKYAAFDRQTVWSEMRRELQFAVRFQGSRQRRMSTLRRTNKNNPNATLLSLETVPRHALSYNSACYGDDQEEKIDRLLANFTSDGGGGNGGEFDPTTVNGGGAMSGHVLPFVEYNNRSEPAYAFSASNNNVARGPRNLFIQRHARNDSYRHRYYGGGGAIRRRASFLEYEMADV